MNDVHTRVPPRGPAGLDARDLADKCDREPQMNRAAAGVRIAIAAPGAGVAELVDALDSKSSSG
jgi:hypothetical protein